MPSRRMEQLVSTRKREEKHRRAIETHTQRLIEKGGMNPKDARERAKNVARDVDRRARDD